MTTIDPNEYNGEYDYYVTDAGEIHDFTHEPSLEMRRSMYNLSEACDRARERQRLADRSIEERLRDFDNEHPFLSGLAIGFGLGAIKDWLTRK